MGPMYHTVKSNKMKRISLIIMLLGLCLWSVAGTAVRKAALSGHVTDEIDHSPLVGVNIYIPELSAGATTDIQGYYHIEDLPAREIVVQVSYVGHKTIIRKVDLSELAVTQDFVMKESDAMINEVVVTGLTGKSLMRELPTPVSVIMPAELQATSSTNIIDAIARKPGISQVTTGSGISKPVIRGLGYNRIVSINDGVRQEGQQWGDEHGIEIDGQDIHSIEVLKGPASLRYGSDAMAGVVIFHDAPTLPRGEVRADVSSEYQTNNGLWAYSVHAAGNNGGVVWGARYSDKMAHSYKNKVDGYLLNSQFREQGLSGLVGLNRSWGYSHLKLSYYHLTPSMVEGHEEEEHAEHEAEPMGRPKAYGHGLPYQQIRHYKAVADNSFYIGQGNLRLILGYQQNQRQEYEEAAEPASPGLDLMLHTGSYDVHYTLSPSRAWTLTTGINGMYQRSLNRGEEVLIPAYALFDLGAFATSSYKTGRWNLAGGVRFDTRHLHSFALEERFDRFSRTFNGLTGSLGATYTVSPQMNLHLNVARGFRAPNLSELGSNGEHEGTFRYEKGNVDLKPEYSWQLDAGWDFTSHYVSAQMQLFVNFIDNYIFSHRLEGQEVEGTPVFQFVQGNARLMGGEASLDFHPIEQLHFENAFSYVHAVQQGQPASSRYLPFTPAPRWTSDLRYDIIRDGRTFNQLFARVGLECNLRQNHYYAANGTETATPSYTLLNAEVGTEVMRHGRKLFSVFLTGHNLTDRAYQSHLSRLKYAGHVEATGRDGYFNMGRNFSIKVLVPIRL